MYPEENHVQLLCGVEHPDWAKLHIPRRQIFPCLAAGEKHSAIDPSLDTEKNVMDPAAAGHLV